MPAAGRKRAALGEVILNCLMLLVKLASEPGSEMQVLESCTKDREVSPLISELIIHNIAF